MCGRVFVAARGLSLVLRSGSRSLVVCGLLIVGAVLAAEHVL